MSNFRSAFDEKRERYFTDSGSKEIPRFVEDSEGNVVEDGKTNLFLEIQSHLDEVLLDKIVTRCSLTGESLLASDDFFGDSTILPKDLLEVQDNVNRVRSLERSLSSEDLSLLNNVGFDEFLAQKIKALTSNSEVVKDE